MRLALFTILSCAFASALPGEGGVPGKYKEPEGKDVTKVTKIWKGGVGGGINGDVGIGVGGCDPAACDALVRYINGDPKRSHRY